MIEDLFTKHPLGFNCKYLNINNEYTVHIWELVDGKYKFGIFTYSSSLAKNYGSGAYDIFDIRSKISDADIYNRQWITPQELERVINILQRNQSCQTIKKSSGCICRKCGAFDEYAESQADGKGLCYICFK